MGTGWQGCTNGPFGCKPQGTISITSDGGKTWKVLLRTPRAVVSVAVDGRHERAVFDDGETIGSSDVGLHWVPVVAGPGFVAGPCPTGSFEYDIPDWALCAWGASAGSQSKALYRLRASGWKRVAANGISSYGYVQGIAMASDGFGVIWESRGTLYVTRNGGRDWTGLTHVAAPEVDFGASAVALRHGVGFVVLAHGGTKARRLIETTDAGRTWHVVHRWS
jgi:photosystem II stability/assembly factor-like uncharacterized protein